jgi:hypothetical protein
VSAIRRPAPARRILAILFIAAATAGCLDAPAQSAAPTPTRIPEPTPTITTYQLGTTVWYEGLLVRVDRAVAKLDEHGGQVEVHLRIENESDESTEVNGAIRLLVGEAAVEPTRESRVPTVPANGWVGALMTYDLQEVPSVDDAVVLVGADPLHVARIPLTEAGGAPIVLEPIPLKLSGRGTAGDLRITLRSGLLRWDLPDWSQELPGGLQALTVTYDATYLGDFTGGFAFTRDNVALRLPSGAVIGPRRDGHSQSIELIGAGKTRAGMFSRFEIPTGMTGRFTLFSVNGAVRTGIPFTIEG